MARAADGFANWTIADIEAHNARVGKKDGARPALPVPSDEPATKPSKYRNVKTVVDGITFDSKREAQYWAELKMREKAGDIVGLERQKSFDLTCPQADHADGINAVVCRYVCDFFYFDKDYTQHVVDAKGKRTAMYQLKKKWLELQSGVIIEEV